MLGDPSLGFRVSGLGLKFSDMFPRRHSYFRFLGQIARTDFMSHPRGVLLASM